ncbi:MAG TPA: TetR/AcrR family transcriptional regulator [Solirubrobacterales bacterium]|nr:TetR/AcrR family transcriptional regulator [Solirubrobacterales bacterium]
MSIAAETRVADGHGAGKGAATRAAILDRAVDLASAEGLEGLTIGRLAGELEMSKSGLFAHFGSKQELQLATVDAAATRFRRAVIDPAAGAADGTPRLRALVDAYLAHLDADAYSGGCFWASTTAEYDDRPGPVRDAIAAAMDAWLGELERQAGIAGLEGPGLVAFELYAVVMGANSRHRLSGDRRVFAYARDAVERLLAQSSRPTWRRIETESE